MSGITEQEKTKAIENGIMPELNTDFEIKIGDKKVYLTEMPILYVRQLNRKVAPIYGLLSGGTSSEDIVKNLLDVNKIDEVYKTILDIAQFILERYDKSITTEWLEQNAGEKVLLNIIQRQLEVNGLVDFLKSVLRALVETIARIPLKTSIPVNT